MMNNLMKILVLSIILLCTILIIFVVRKEKFTPIKQNVNKSYSKIPIKNNSKKLVKNKYNYDLLNRYMKTFQFSQKVQKGEQKLKFKNNLLNHRMILFEKIQEMIKGRSERLKKMLDQYSKDKSTYTTMPTNIRNEIKAYFEMINKNPMNKKKDFIQILTKGIDKKSPEYTRLYYTAMQMNDMHNKTDLCSRDKKCKKFTDEIKIVYDSRRKTADNMSRIIYSDYLVKGDIKEKYNEEDEITFVLDATDDIPQEEECEYDQIEKPPCTWWDTANYGVFCGPTPSAWNTHNCRGLHVAFDNKWEPCNELDACCRQHDIDNRECKRQGDPCLSAVGDGWVAAGFCPTLCNVTSDLNMCLCAIQHRYPSVEELASYVSNNNGILDGAERIAFGQVAVTVFCNPLKYIISCIVGTLYLIVQIIIYIITLLVELVLWVSSLILDLIDWFGEQWDDFWEWWNEEDKKYQQSNPNITIETEESIQQLVIAVINTEGTDTEQIENILDSISHIFNIDDQDGLKIQRRRSGPREVVEIKPQQPRKDLVPIYQDNKICSSVCYNGYPGIRCINRETGEVVSETWESSQNTKKCCTNKCINGTWHTVCPPHPGINTETSCEQRPPKL